MRSNNIAIVLVAASLFCAQPLMAQGSVNHSTQAVNHSGYGIAHGALGGAKLVSGVAATPLLAIGKAGQASGRLGDVLWDAANKPMGAALPVTDKTLTVSPSPDKVLARDGTNR